jgi:hypothetical protein
VMLAIKMEALPTLSLPWYTDGSIQVQAVDTAVEQQQSDMQPSVTVGLNHAQSFMMQGHAALGQHKQDKGKVCMKRSSTCCTQQACCCHISCNLQLHSRIPTRYLT